MMSLNIYNTRYRAYKKRNLQLAVQRIVEWMTTHPTLAEAGPPTQQIYTGQSFIDAAAAVHIDNPAFNWLDQTGVSIEGGKPPDGQIGTILYGATPRNEGTLRSGPSLLWNIQRTDPVWGVIEFHPAMIPFPEQMPSHIQAYRSMQALYNHGARFLMPMYGGSMADRELRPESFCSYATLQGSAFEYEFFWWLKQVRDLPLGSLHFPFGNTHGE